MKRNLSLLVLLLISAAAIPQSHDWPVWRYDHNRSASSPEQLADKLFLQWEIKYNPRTPVWDDPLNRDLMQFDRIFEPIVAGGKIYIGFNDQDKVTAFDLETGKELWNYYADGPVRLPIAASRGNIYFTSDDGACYCLNGSTGKLVWKRMLAPAGNKLIGNRRLISMWPARGGIVIKDDVLYTAASIFPMMGTFIYALDTATGDIVWKNESTGSNYILQPHRSPAFADVAPQGPFTITGNILLVAGGRSVPAAFDLKTGEELYYHLAASGKTGGAFTCANDQVFFNHHRDRITVMYDSETGNKLKSEAGEYPVIDGNTIYFSGEKISAASLGNDKNLKTVWSVDVPATRDLIRAGDKLYSAHEKGISAVRITPGKEPELVWNWEADSTTERLLAASGKLVAVGYDGSIRVFGPSQKAPVTAASKKEAVNNRTATTRKNGVNYYGVTEGYAMIFGAANAGQLESIVGETKLSVTAFERDPARIEKLRSYFDRRGVTSDRLSFILFNGDFTLLPKYSSSLTVINDISFAGAGDADVLKVLYETTRPYDGKIVFRAGEKDYEVLRRTIAAVISKGAEISSGGREIIVRRTGPLEGAAPWTHNYGDIANTIKSEDQLVKAPLGILWFGGSPNTDVLPRHGHGPGEQVIDGRLIIQGMSSISARDVYTGRVLWKRESEKLMDDNWLVFYDETYDEENPLDPKYNQVHLPGANARGTNFIATKEYVYLIEGNKCTLIDIKTGATVKEFSTGDDNTRELGYIGVYDDLLILGSNFAEYTPALEGDSILIKNPKFTDYDLTASRELIVMDRFTGKRLWSIPAHHGFIHNSVIAGDEILFCLDKLPQYIETKLRRRGEPLPEGTRLLYVDIRSGKIIREETKDIFGTWLGYSARHKLLLQATRPSRDMLNGEEGNRMIAYNAASHEKIWDKAVRYANPPIIHNESIFTNGEGFDLLTGEPLTEKDPITGEDLRWNFKREYGCGIVAASEYLLTFRSASAGFINLEAFEGTGSLGGWKPGCSTNLIAADGVLNSPDYTRTCQCPYQNQTSLALINMPWMAYWTNSNYKWNGKQIKRLGINLNAPGDRASDDNTLWLEYPVSGGSSPDIPMKIDTAGFGLIRKEPVSVMAESTPWISASAVKGLKSIEITLSKDDLPETSYTVVLYFSELEAKRKGERLFDVAIQGQKVLESFDIAAEAGKADREVRKPFHGVKAGRLLRIDMEPVKGNTILSGIEIIQDQVAGN